MKLLSIILFLQEEFDGGFVSKLVPNLWTFLAQLIAFIIMIVAVIFLAYKPVAKFIKARKEYIANNLEEAKVKNEEASKNLAETKKNLQGSQKEAIQIIQDAKKQAEMEKEAIMEETKKEIAAKHAKAQDDIRIEQEKALKDMHDDVIDLALEATKNILGREVNANDDKQLLDAFVSDLIDEKVEK